MDQNHCISWIISQHHMIKCTSCLSVFRLVFSFWSNEYFISHGISSLPLFFCLDRALIYDFKSSNFWSWILVALPSDCNGLKMSHFHKIHNNVFKWPYQISKKDVNKRSKLYPKHDQILQKICQNVQSENKIKIHLLKCMVNVFMEAPSSNNNCEKLFGLFQFTKQFCQLQASRLKPAFTWPSSYRMSNQPQCQSKDLCLVGNRIFFCKPIYLIDIVASYKCIFCTFFANLCYNFCAASLLSLSKHDIRDIHALYTVNESLKLCSTATSIYHLTVWFTKIWTHHCYSSNFEASFVSVSSFIFSLYKATFWIQTFWIDSYFEITKELG